MNSSNPEIDYYLTNYRKVSFCFLSEKKICFLHYTNMINPDSSLGWYSQTIYGDINFLKILIVFRDKYTH